MFSLNEHDTIIDIRFFERVGNLILREPYIEVSHLIAEFLNIIDHDEGVCSHLRQREEEIVEIFTLHRIDIDKVEKFIRKCRNHFFGISPDRLNIFYLTLRKVLNCFDMSIPGIFDGSYRVFGSWSV